MADVKRLVDRHLTRATDSTEKLCRYLVLAATLAVLAAGLGVGAVLLVHGLLGSWPAAAGIGGTTSTLGLVRLLVGRRSRT
jgi:hypothetical protein